MKEVLSLSDMREKKIGLGEDSDPIFLNKDSFIAVGVLDGMGGAGGAECISDFGNTHTKAYVASRIIKDAIENVLSKLSQLPDTPQLTHLLEKTITERYNEEISKYPPNSKSGLRSTLIKEYPTTLAMTCVSSTTNTYIIDSIWAGDSRNYIWNKNGLFQISIDDLKGGIDPLQNLYEDAPMSNCLQANFPVQLNHRIFEFPKSEKFIVISTTDGCFGYYPSPMDYEKILCDSLYKATSIKDWKNILSKAFSYVTADDFSYSIAAIGFSDFKNIKKTLRSSNKGSLTCYYDKRREYERKIRKRNALDEEIAELQTQLDSDIQEIWPIYKQTYLKFISTDEER